ncbi:P-loop containing nucleoside triphosphate hydrolase protein [Irpex rosettiformis]|uniref:P-loop containing nucleoside triphosphate hydrolase protein n=1 Tax=Irpex rosettiformis TaxID=378272 RepID=A0ACB8UI42_9APHY|nr:P-loop containing nucleoside triphosphate hydrolase protein [Irpex rosettiformis]
MASKRVTNLPRGTRPNKPPPSSSSLASNSRSHSAAARSTTSQRSDATTLVEGTNEAPAPLRTSKTQANKEDNGSNIRVVIRCRRRSEREVQENSPIIVTNAGRRSQEITIETAAPVSALGVVTLPPTRTYPFDLVFGPEADQGDIYHDVVAPMLEEVTQGYNCTLFAYGQTGTGKTYTMQGDLTRTAMGNPSAQAGMIPRALFRLFHQLESSGADYTVKVSFIELYNEELRDLLASDLSAPMDSRQPMGMGGKDAAIQAALKIFDDSSKKGVFIQGLEECAVKDADHALALLTKGSERRQIAATKFNDHSSRSHSVFSITVHVKETSSIGDDLLKVGKLNLVDLAGSENIGRSGAENKRAREAGMINQSLLTLGRVINALVDRSAHVPYRESKLTRLLQDSLGGRTKTCIIATISPARFNMEETLSTLDYAIRAKSIRNKPELNQRMTRNALLKEYVGEIERLKADLLAAREKNGIFFSEETWQQMTAEQELKDTEMQEARKQVAIIESQLRNVREEFEQSIALLTKRDGELKETKEKLQKTETNLVVTEGELKNTKGALEEEMVVRQAYQENETMLDGVATGLKSVAHQSVSDLGRLFGKLERKTSVLTSNVQAVTAHTRKITTESREFSTKVEDFVKGTRQHVTNIRAEAEQYHAKELETLAGVSAKINQQVEKVQEILKVIRSKEEASDEAMSNLETTLNGTQDGIKAAFDLWAVDVRRHCEVTCKEVEASAVASCSTVEKAFKSLGSITETVLQEAQEYIVSERKSLQDAKAMADTTTQAEISRLQSQNILLSRALDVEKAKSERAKDELVKRIIALFDAFTAEREESLRGMFSEIAESNTAAEAGMEKLGKDQGQRLDSLMGRGREWGDSLTKRADQSKLIRDGGVKAVSVSNASMKDNFASIQSSLSESINGFSGNLKRTLQQSSTAYTEAYDNLQRTKRARMDAMDSMTADTQAGYRYMERGISSSTRSTEVVMGKISSEVNGLSQLTEAYSSSAVAHLSEIYHASQSLADQGAREDMPTGTTPRKRAWEFNDKWQLTKARETLLHEHQLQPASGSSRSVPEPRSSSLEMSEVPEMVESEGEVSESQTDCEEGAFSEASQAEEDPDTTITMSTSPGEPKSLASSTSSSSSRLPTSQSRPPPPVEIRRLARKRKSLLPVKGTLTERSTNVFSGRPSKRVAR